jgi:hypothetical protein
MEGKGKINISTPEFTGISELAKMDDKTFEIAKKRYGEILAMGRIAVQSGGEEEDAGKKKGDVSVPNLAGLVALADLDDAKFNLALERFGKLFDSTFKALMKTVVKMEMMTQFPELSDALTMEVVKEIAMDPSTPLKVRKEIAKDISVPKELRKELRKTMAEERKIAREKSKVT